MIGKKIIEGKKRVKRERIEEMGRKGFVERKEGYERMLGIYKERSIVM